MRYQIRVLNGVVIFGLALTALGGCRRSGTEDERKIEATRAREQQKVDEAQKREQTEITSAEVEAAKRSERAKEHADKEVQKVSADFAKRRSEYKDELSKKLVDVDKKIAKAEDESRTASGSKKAKIDAALPDIRARRQALANDLRLLDNADISTWDSTKDKLDTDQKALRDAVDNLPFTAR